MSVAAQTFLWGDLILLAATAGACSYSVFVASHALRDFVDECTDPFFLNEGLEVADEFVTDKEADALRLLHDGIVQVASLVPQASGLVKTFGWMLEYQAGSALSQTHLFALQQLMPVATIVQRLVYQTLRVLRDTLESMCVGMTVSAALAFVAFATHAALIAFSTAYWNAVLGVSRTYVGAAFTIAAKRIVRLAIKFLNATAFGLVLVTWSISHFVLPEVTRLSFVFTCKPPGEFDSALTAALVLASIAQAVAFLENWVWRTLRIHWIKSNCSAPEYKL